MRVFITGASAGLGRALALQYGARGAVLGLVARRAVMLDGLAAGASPSCSVYPIDVRDSTSMNEAAAHFLSLHGVPDIVVANAGISVGTVSELREDLLVFQDVLDVNVMGIVKTFQPFLGAMRAAGHGALVGIASVAGYRGLPGAAAYSASKAAAISYLESLRVELYGSGVDVITICPGYIATDMTARNPYGMPFIMSADDAAVKIVRAIARRRSFVVMPWQMAVVAKLLRVLPNAIFDRLFARAPHKPRRA